MTQPSTTTPGRDRASKLRTSADCIEHLPKLYRDAAYILVQTGEIEIIDIVTVRPGGESA